MASAYSSYSKSPSGRELRRMRMYVSTSQSNTDTQSKVTVTGNCHVDAAALYGIATVVGHNGGGGTPAASSQVATGVMQQYSTVANGSKTFTFNRKEAAYSVTFYCKNSNKTVNGYGAWNGPVVTASVSVSIPAKVYQAHGNPTVTLATNCLQGEQVTVSWKKSGTQGNASFTRFELWQGSNKLYSGSNTSYKVTPSSVTGAKGGNVTYTVKEIHTWNGSEKTTSASKTIAVYGAHGNPVLTASKSTANYGESVNLSWEKSATQGNAPFTRFELWQGDARLYSGSAVSKSVVPSDATGPKGGTATYVLKEIHTWYGSEKTTQTSKGIEVRSGVVSVYDASGNRHTGLVTAYDSSGTAHYVLITAYDSSGKAHSVV